MIKVLNCYSGLGGNRKKWTGAAVTAVEIDPTLAAAYSAGFPEDEMIVGDAHEYLLNNYQRFDFIWLSRPCQSHSSMRKNLAVRFRGTPPVYPDFGLYEEIVFLQHHAVNQLWVAENVNPYYEPLIKPTAKIGRHLFWSNFEIPEFYPASKTKLRSAQIPDLSAYHGFDLAGWNIPNKRQVLRNCVDAEIGEHIFNAAKKGNILLSNRRCRLTPYH